MSNTTSDLILQNADYLTLQKLAHPQDFEWIKSVLRTFERELQPGHGYFQSDDWDKIRRQALDLFLKKLIQMGAEDLSSEEVHYAWSEVRSDFLKKYWGFQKFQEKPLQFMSPQIHVLPTVPADQIPAKPPEKTSMKDAFFYIWSVLQSFIITKALILVYGNELAKDDSPENRWIFGIILFFSFGSLIFFAWLRRNKKYR